MKYPYPSKDKVIIFYRKLIEEYMFRIGGEDVRMMVWDTAGQETYQEFRKLAYKDCDILFFFCSVVDRDSGRKLLPVIYYFNQPEMLY